MERNRRDEMLKEAAAQQCCDGNTASPNATTGRDYGELKCAMPGLKERLQDRLGHAKREARKREHLEELVYLLDKNPDVARILELVELTGA